MPYHHHHHHHHDRSLKHSSWTDLESPCQVHGVRHCAAARPARRGWWESADWAQPVVCTGACIRGSAGAVFNRMEVTVTAAPIWGELFTLRTLISRMRWHARRAPGDLRSQVNFAFNFTRLTESFFMVFFFLTDFGTTVVFAALEIFGDVWCVFLCFSSPVRLRMTRAV